MRKLFKNPRAISAIVPPAPAEVPGGGLPAGGGVCCMCNIGMSVRLCFGVSCGIARARSFVCDRGHVVAVAVSCPGRRGRGRRAVAVASLGVAVARCGRDVAAWFCVAVAWLRHADEC